MDIVINRINSVKGFKLIWGFFEFNDYVVVCVSIVEN